MQTEKTHKPRTFLQFCLKKHDYVRLQTFKMDAVKISICNISDILVGRTMLLIVYMWKIGWKSPDLPPSTLFSKIIKNY